MTSASSDKTLTCNKIDIARFVLVLPRLLRFGFGRPKYNNSDVDVDIQERAYYRPKLAVGSQTTRFCE